MVDKFKEMDTSLSQYNTRVMCLTVDTSNALGVTLGLIALIKLLLSKGFKYVLPGTFQSDRLEGEFGVYRQSAGGCSYISLQQIMNSLSVQRLKLFDKLEIESKSAHVTEDCCSESLNNEEVEMLAEGFDLVSTLTEVEKSSLYYIVGYVAAKENLSVSNENDNQHPNSEFSTLLSRGKLSHPPLKLFDLTCVLYTYHQEVHPTPSDCFSTTLRVLSFGI